MSYASNLLQDQNIGALHQNEKRGAPEPVRLQPSWEESNLPEDELNFKHLTMEDASLQMTAPRDKLNLVYLTFLIHGIGVLTPWNMFITASKYFTEYKLLNTTYATSFLASVGFASQVPNVVFNWLNVFVQMGGNLTTRIVWSITVEVIIFIITVILAMIDSDEWKGTFFWFTMVCVVILNMANGIYQNTIFGMAAKLPIKYTGAVVLGSNISGTFTSIVLILSDTFASSQRMSAIYYFITALFVLLVCFDTYFALPLNRFYKHYKLKEEREAEVSKQNNRGRARQIPYLYVFRKAFPQLFNIFLVFFVTLSIFPAIQADVRRSDTNEFFINEKYFTSITCFLTFNMSAMIGSFLTGFFTWPKPKYLWIPIAIRILYIPFFLLCNYQVSKVERMLPVVVDNEWIYWVVAITMGLSSGYLSSLGMMYAPRTVESQYAATAGMFGAAALITGIFTGVLTAFVWPVLIANVGF